MGGPRMILRICLLLVSTVAMAAGEPPDMSCGMSNGRAWRTLPVPYRVTRIVGMRDFAIGMNAREWNTVAVAGMSIGDTAEAITKIYEDPVNLNIPVPWTLLLIRMRADGKPQLAIDEAFTQRRTWVLECPEII